MKKDQDANVPSSGVNDSGVLDSQCDGGTTFDKQLDTERPLIALPENLKPWCWRVEALIRRPS